MWPIAIRRRETIRILGALIVICLAAAVVLVALRQRSAPTTTSRDTPYAYLTSDTIAVARGSHVFATAHGLFGIDGGLMTTLDGRYVAAITEQDADADNPTAHQPRRIDRHRHRHRRQLSLRRLQQHHGCRWQHSRDLARRPNR